MTPVIGGNIAVEWRQWRGDAVLTGQDKDVWAATVQAVGDDDLAHASPASAGEALLAGDMHSMLPQYLTVQHAGAILGISDDGVRRRLARGVLHGILLEQRGFRVLLDSIMEVLLHGRR